MNISPDVKAYVEEKIKARGQKELDRLQAEVDKIRDARNRNQDIIDDFEDRDDSPDEQEEQKIAKELDETIKEIRAKIYPNAKKRLAKIGWKVGNRGLDFLLLADLDTYTLQDAYSDNEISRIRKSDASAKRVYEKAKKENKRLGDLLSKAEIARNKFQDRVWGAIKEALVLIELGTDISEFKKIIADVKI